MSTKKTKPLLEQDLGEYKDDNEIMVNTILELKKSIKSYKSANTILRKKNKELDAYGKEADELNEKRISYIDELKAALCNKDNEINILESRVRVLNEIINELHGEIDKLKDKIFVAEANEEYFIKLPWYKKLFFKDKFLP